MHPVLPRTIVRGPAALTISFMTRADSHPWQVRWPEEKYSSIVTFLTPLKGSSTWVSLAKAVVVSAMVASLLAHAQPAGGPLGLAGPRRGGADVGHFIHVLQRDLATAEPADEPDERRPMLRVVERGPDLGGHDPGAERGAERVIAVDHAEGLGLPERPGQL